jgi:hypothetical protein
VNTQTNTRTNRQTDTQTDISTYRKHRPRVPMLWKCWGKVTQIKRNSEWSRPWQPLSTTVSEGFILKCLAIFFRQENVNQKYETHPVKSYFTKQL